MRRMITRRVASRRRQTWPGVDTPPATEQQTAAKRAAEEPK